MLSLAAASPRELLSQHRKETNSNPKKLGAVFPVIFWSAKLSEHRRSHMRYSTEPAETFQPATEVEKNKTPPPGIEPGLPRDRRKY